MPIIGMAFGRDWRYNTVKIKEPPQDDARHRKKSKTASRSNSSKRADHKHQYERIIMKWIFGYQWGRRCTVCGRIDDGFGNYSSARHQDFLKPEALKKPGISNRDYLSLKEIRTKYPGIDVYKLGDRVPHGGWNYTLVTNDEDN